MKIRKCTICGDDFESRNGIEVCSEYCKKIRKNEQDRKSNYRRKMGLSNTPISRICPICGEKFEGLREIYCSAKCRGVGIKNKRIENFKRYYEENRKEIIEKVKERKRARKQEL